MSGVLFVGSADRLWRFQLSRTRSSKVISGRHMTEDGTERWMAQRRAIEDEESMDRELQELIAKEQKKGLN